MKHGVVFKFGEMSNLTNINAVEFECDFACARNSGGARVFSARGKTSVVSPLQPSTPILSALNNIKNIKLR